MTPAQADWLRKLRDGGPQPRPRYGAKKCVRLFNEGLLQWHLFPGWEVITPAGLAALEAHEKETTP